MSRCKNKIDVNDTIIVAVLIKSLLAIYQELCWRLYVHYPDVHPESYMVTHPFYRSSCRSTSLTRLVRLFIPCNSNCKK